MRQRQTGIDHLPVAISRQSIARAFQLRNVAHGFSRQAGTGTNVGNKIDNGAFAALMIHAGLERTAIVMGQKAAM